jgi:hypothetical protein
VVKKREGGGGDGVEGAVQLGQGKGEAMGGQLSGRAGKGG